MDWIEHVTSTKEMAHLDRDDRFRFNLVQQRRWSTFELVSDYHKGGETYLHEDRAKPGIRRWRSDSGEEAFASDFQGQVNRIVSRAPEERGS